MSFGHQMLSATCFCRVFGVEFELEVKANVTVVAQLEKNPKMLKKKQCSHGHWDFSKSKHLYRPVGQQSDGQVTIYIHGRPT